MNKILTASATELAKMIKTDAHSAVEILNTHISQIEKVNPVINALVANRFDEAREEARLADKRVKSGEKNLPPLLGVPFTVKEAFAVKGMPNTSGLVARKGVIAQADAEVVKRLRQAGAIPIGVTNLSELGMWMETNNMVYGRTNNPYKPSRIVGGSSGGEGAIVAAGGAPFGIGSDLGGSIRSPAFFNGVFGHKPTGGLVPGTGQYPNTENEALRYLTTGPLCRKAADLMTILKIMAGPDGIDKGCREFVLEDPLKMDISKLTVINVEDDCRISPTRELKEAQARVISALARLGATIKLVRLKELKDAFNIWSSMIKKATVAPFSEVLGNGRDVNFLLELFKWPFGLSEFTLPSIVITILEKLPFFTQSHFEHYYQMGKELQKRLTELIGENGVMVYPSYPQVAPWHNKPIFMPFHWTYMGIFNVLEFPVTQIPLGLNKEGLPMGVQIASISGKDHLTIAVAMELEKEFGGWIPPA